MVFTENCRGNFRPLSVLASIPLGAWGTHLQAAGFSLGDVSVPLFIFDFSVHHRVKYLYYENNSERPVDALAEKGELLTDLQLEIKRC